MSLTIRRATPADADACVPLIYSSGPAAFERVFASGQLTAQDFLRPAFCSGLGQFGCRQHWLIEENGQILATGTAYSGRDTLAYGLRSDRQIIARYGLGAALGVLGRGLAMERLLPPPPRNTWYLAHLGVAAQARGQGFGQQLIDHLEQQGRAAGFERVALDVAVSNPRAQALYERLGYRLEKERRSTITGVADHRYLTKAL